MKPIKNLILSAAAGMLLMAHITAAPETSFDLAGLSVDVKSTGPASVSHQILPEENGFTRVAIVFSNHGDLPLTIEEINISIPTTEPLVGGEEVVHGSSCMGRTPLLREMVGNDGQDSYSYMFELVRLAEKNYLFAGSLSWRVFLPVLSMNEKGLNIFSDGEGKQLGPGESVAFEQIVVGKASDSIELLNRFGKAIARENGIKKVKDVDFKGWATWDYYGRLFRSDDVLENLREIDALYPESNLIQMDGGWWTERGDYTSVRENLPGGIQALAEAIKQSGKIAGLHFDGFRADLSSEVYNQHPEYFLHDQDGKIIVDVREMFDRTMRYIYFDYSHPGAREHIMACVKEMREWGITYFKVDFMRYGLESEIKEQHPSVEKILAHDSTLSGVERFRLGMSAIREAIGEENYFLGCSAVFGPCIGFVDGMRTGGDIHPRYEAFPERCLANLGNFYLDGVVFNGDADYLVFREEADEDERVSRAKHKFGGTLPIEEAQTWADFNKLYGNCRLSSDNLMLLREERKQLVREVLEWPAMDESIPLDIWRSASDDMDGFERILARNGKDIYLGIFNWGDTEKSYDLKAFGLSTPLVMGGRSSTILEYEGERSFRWLQRKLQEK